MLSKIWKIVSSNLFDYAEKFFNYLSEYKVSTVFSSACTNAGKQNKNLDNVISSKV